MPDKQAKIELAREKYRDKAISFFNLFNTPDGKVVLDELKEQFVDRTSIVPGDPYATHANEGAREVILFINQMMEISNE